jgi:alpha-galactosidase
MLKIVGRDAKLSPPAGTSYLSDLRWRTATNSWGPVERDMSNGENAAGDGHAITIAGKTYAKGLGVHAASEIHYTLGGVCSSVTADVGLDDEKAGGSVVFQVWADGTKLYDSGTMTGGASAKSLNVDVSGKQDLSLVVTDGGDGNTNDHADWADAKVTCSP